MEGQQGVVPAVQAAASGDTQSIPPELQREMKAYQTMINKIIHGKKTRKDVMEMLKSGDPEMAVPVAALQIDKVAAKGTGGKVSMEARMAGGVYIVSELLDLGVDSGKWEQPSDQQAQMIFQDTLQDYIEMGLKDGSIDPIELQQGVEPLLNDEQKQVGGQIGGQYGVPAQGSPHQAVANARALDETKASKKSMLEEKQ